MLLDKLNPTPAYISLQDNQSHTNQTVGVEQELVINKSYAYVAILSDSPEPIEASNESLSILNKCKTKIRHHSIPHFHHLNIHNVNSIPISLLGNGKHSPNLQQQT